MSLVIQIDFYEGERVITLSAVKDLTGIEGLKLAG